jgi:hypothetical protein
MPRTVLTDLAVAKIAEAAGSGEAVAISHVALGDGNGTTYSPVETQTALRRELARQPIARRELTAQNVWRVLAEFPTDTPAFMVREIGFFDTEGDLIALWAGTDVEPRQTGVIEYITEHLMDFSRVAPGLIEIVSEDQDWSDFALATAALLARQQHEQNRQRVLLIKANFRFRG